MNDHAHQGAGPPQGTGGVVTFRPPVAAALRSPGTLTPLRAPYALSPRAAQAQAVQSAQPQAQPAAALPFATPQPPYAAQAAVPSTPVAAQAIAPPAMVTAPPAFVAGAVGLGPAVREADLTAPRAEPPSDPGAMAAPKAASQTSPMPVVSGPDAAAVLSAQPAAVASIPSASPAARGTDPHIDAAHAAVSAAPPEVAPAPVEGGPNASPWAGTLSRVEPAVLPSAHIAPRVEEPVRAAPPPPQPRASGGGRGIIVLLVVVLVIAAGAFAYLFSLRRVGGPSDPISIGVKDDRPAGEATAEPTATEPTASASATAKPKLPAPNPNFVPPKPAYPAYTPPPPPPPSPHYEPTTL